MKLTNSQALELRESITAYIRAQDSFIAIMFQAADENDAEALTGVISYSCNLLQETIVELGDMTKAFTGEECPIINGIFYDMTMGVGEIDTRKARSLTEIAFMYQKQIKAGVTRLAKYCGQLTSYGIASNDDTLLV